MAILSHPAADIFPMLDDENLRRLSDDIKANGLREPIVMLSGEVLDGRNRLRACEMAGVTPKFVQHDGSDPWRYVWSLNRERRHITDAIRLVLIAKEMIAGSDAWAKAREKAKENADKARSEAAKRQHEASNPRAGEKYGQPSREGRPESTDRTEATRKNTEASRLAREAGVSRATAERASSLERKSPERARAVIDGRIEGSKALSEVKREERIDRLVEVAKGNTELTGELGRFPVIYADPPWQYDESSTDPTRIIENQYPTMPIEAICALPIQDLCTDDAILFMWATSPLLHKAIEVVKAWGFNYKTCAIWDKEKIGMGYFFRQQHELLLVAERGNIPKPPPAARVSSVYREARGQHSAKPHRYYEFIEAMYPELPKLELFCRSPRKGWKAWGNQAQ